MPEDFAIEAGQETGEARLSGRLDLYHAQKARQALKKTNATRIDLSRLTKLDTVGALLLREWHEAGRVTLQGLRPEHAALFQMVSKMEIAPPAEEKIEATWRRLIKLVGRQTIMAWVSMVEILAFFGQAGVSSAKSVRSLRHLRLPSIMHHIEQTGIQAIPIVALIAFLIAVVLAYQGQAQLKPLGGEHYTVNLVSISVLREMGVLLTAIMVAGRSGSAFTAEIGVMRVREEVDALQVIGMDPFEVLVMPRLIALIITLPLLTFIADICGLLGGGFICSTLIGTPLPQYLEQVRHVAKPHDFMVGMIKAPVFAFLIATVGCMHGMKVSGSAESVGTQTTTSVVKSIFLVLIADAVFSILFQKIGI